MSIRKTYQGAIEISDIINGYLVTRQYFGHTKRQAIRLFKQETQHTTK
jgi:hypothetical protein